jgi:hypothetical protein
MHLDGNEERIVALPNMIAKCLDNKKKDIVNSVNCEESVYNVGGMVISIKKIFMGTASTREYMATLKTKNNKGYDKTKQRLLADRKNELILSLEGLFTLIYAKKVIPEKWLIAKTVPLHKKVKKDKEKFSFFANLWSKSLKNKS